jgi:hypothetical protein
VGIELHFNLWNHFFRARLLPCSGTEVVVLGGMVIDVRYGHGVDPCFHLPMLSSTDGWRKVWFFLRNDVDAPLLVFTCSRPVQKPNWWYGVARKDLCRLQPMREVIEQL